MWLDLSHSEVRERPCLYNMSLGDKLISSDVITLNGWSLKQGFTTLLLHCCNLFCQENIKSLYKSLMSLLSQQNHVLTVFALAILASLCINDDLGENVSAHSLLSSPFQLSTPRSASRLICLYVLVIAMAGSIKPIETSSQSYVWHAPV